MNMERRTRREQGGAVDERAKGRREAGTTQDDEEAAKSEAGRAPNAEAFGLPMVLHYPEQCGAPAASQKWAGRVSVCACVCVCAPWDLPASAKVAQH